MNNNNYKQYWDKTVITDTQNNYGRQTRYTAHWCKVKKNLSNVAIPSSTNVKKNLQGEWYCVN